MSEYSLVGISPSFCVNNNTFSFDILLDRVPQRLENESGHGNVMEYEKLAKSHGIL